MTTEAASESAPSAMCSPSSQAALPAAATSAPRTICNENSASVPSAKPTSSGRSRCPNQAATVTQTVSASVPSTAASCERPHSPVATTTAVPAAAPSALRRSQGPGAGCGSGTFGGLLSDSLAEIAERAMAGHVGHGVEVVLGGRRGRVPLEGICLERVVTDPRAAPPALDHVHDEDE